MDQLGVKAVRPGPNPNDPSTFDESTANPYKDSMPDVLKLKDGTKVTKASQWPRRRAEIVEDFEREVYGRIPKNVPKVTWEVTATTPGNSGGVPTLTRTLVGHVDNSAYPAVDGQHPGELHDPGKGDAPDAADDRVRRLRRLWPYGVGRHTRWQDQAIAKGWAYGSINPGSIQPDNNRLTYGNHRPDQQRPAAQAGRLGRASRLAMGR